MSNDGRPFQPYTTDDPEPDLRWRGQWADVSDIREPQVRRFVEVGADSDAIPVGSETFGPEPPAYGEWIDSGTHESGPRWMRIA